MWDIIKHYNLWKLIHCTIVMNSDIIFIIVVWGYHCVWLRKDMNKFSYTDVEVLIKSIFETQPPQTFRSINNRAKSPTACALIPMPRKNVWTVEYWKANVHITAEMEKPPTINPLTTPRLQQQHTANTTWWIKQSNIYIYMASLRTIETPKFLLYV